MRHDVIMPALGMAQDTGKLIAWSRSEGEPVTEGDVLFEVETDKATMEVEAPASGFLVGITAQDGEDVPVGKVIAAISDTAEEPASAPEDTTAGASAPADPDELPAGSPVIMPVLGMAQDSGVLVRWLKEVGDPLTADDILFEVETDKSVVEVEANKAGYLVARLAAAGDDVPTGETIAIIANEATDHTVDRPYQQTGGAAEKKAEPEPAEQTESARELTPVNEGTAQPERKSRKPKLAHGKILASPKLKRMAHQASYDLADPARTDLAQPFLSRDFEALKKASEASHADAVAVQGAVMTRLSAQVGASELDAFIDWAADAVDATENSIIAAFAGASLTPGATVRVERYGTGETYDTHPQLSLTTASDNEPDLIVQDLRGTYITSVELPATAQPIIALMGSSEALTLTLACSADGLSAVDAAELLNNFAGRMADPVRHLF